MRLLIVSGFWPTRGNPITGVFVQQQVKAFVELGCECVVLVPQLLRSWQHGRPYRQVYFGSPVFSPIAPDIPQALSGGATAVLLNIKSSAASITMSAWRLGLRRGFDGVLIHDVRYAGLAYPDWRKSIRGTSILTIHGVDPFLAARAKKIWMTERLSATWQALDAVTLVGSPLHRYAENLGVPKQKCTVVANGTDLPTDYSTHQRALTERRRIVSVSNLVKLKGIDLNLRALAEIRSHNPGLIWDYHVVGDGPERSSLERLASSLGLTDRVRFFGRLDHENTLYQIAQADIFSLPSWGENFGIVYLEAMARGRPVIGCHGWGAADIFLDGREGALVEPHCVDSLQLALYRLLCNPEECTAMGERGRETAQRFSWRANAEAYMAMFSGHSQPKPTPKESDLWMQQSTP